jgi:bifunctional enzyme CysN/CysC
MSWFSGPTLLSALGSSACEKARAELPFRFPVQMIVRDGHDFRGLAGTVVSGHIACGDEVVEMQGGKRARVARIVTFDGDRSSAAAGAAVAIELDTDLDVSRGGLLARPASPARLLREIEARLVWLSDLQPAGTGLLLRTATDLVPVGSFAVTARLDLERLIWRQDRDCGANDVVDVRISLGRRTALDRFEELAPMGSFILVDALSGGTVAGGIVKGGEETAARSQGKVFHLSRALLAATVCADLPSCETSRQEFRRRAAEVAFLLSAAGVSVDLENFDDAPMEDGGSGI